MTITMYVSRDAAALAVDADGVAAAIAGQALARKADVQIVRNGSRGLLWLEAMVEVQTDAGRIAYGPVRAEDVPSLFDAGFLHGGVHALRLGITEEIPEFERQQRLSFARCGLGDPLAPVPWLGLKTALEIPPEAIVQEVLESGLRGRGGAAFPAGIKWRTVAQTASAQKYVVCNADEGDSGTFADRMLLEGDPYLLIEGMAIAALAVGASKGFVYIRSEYPHAIATFESALQAAREAGVLGASMLGSGIAFDIEARVGGGSYVCGEETAMLESVEGKRGIVRAKPPLPAVQGLFGQPTVINNVLTFAAVPTILEKGAEFYKNFGTGRSRGTLPFQLAGNIKRGGLFELPFGLTLRELVFDIGGGAASGRPVKAIQVGGPLGAYVPESQWDLPLDYDAYTAKGLVLGHGGIVVHDDTADMAQLARFAMEFCAIESCGKCTPCRIGSTRGVEVIDRIVRNHNRPQQVRLLRDLCDTMLAGSLCAMGGMTPFPVLSALDHYPRDFGLVDDDAKAA
ncbi:MAG TPA: NADH-ubiquinone oxidoreductase-F iron-sulfur binding region domain-containing protein [Burkholderiaceae bacterium]|jgi:formate dehydrogenase iron-sulfur subunit|nr:NADH-ubiquinone oxidoreductase-F iron-sulfur binding region domain-containing protein [Burkholderiaceae bacterium]